MILVQANVELKVMTRCLLQLYVIKGSNLFSLALSMQVDERFWCLKWFAYRVIIRIHLLLSVLTMNHACILIARTNSITLHNSINERWANKISIQTDSSKTTSTSWNKSFWLIPVAIPHVREVPTLKTMPINNIMFVITSNEYWTCDSARPIIVELPTYYLLIYWYFGEVGRRWHIFCGITTCRSVCVAAGSSYIRRRQDLAGQWICAGLSVC